MLDLINKAVIETIQGSFDGVVCGDCVAAQTRYPMEMCGQRRFKCDRTTNELLEVSLVYLWSSTFCQTDQSLDKLSKVCILYPFNNMHSITWICMHAWGLPTIGSVWMAKK